MTGIEIASWSMKEIATARLIASGKSDEQMVVDCEAGLLEEWERGRDPELLEALHKADEVIADLEDKLAETRREIACLCTPQTPPMPNEPND